MSYQKWATVLTGLLCIALGISGGLMYPLTEWGILEILGYEIMLFLLTYGILRLVYNRALSQQA